MRTAAQVFKLALAVEGDVLIGRNTGDDFCLVVLAHFTKMRHGLITRQYAAGDGFIPGGEFAHFLFNGLQIFRGERPFVGKIVKETVLDHRADGDLCLREKALDGVG